MFARARRSLLPILAVLLAAGAARADSRGPECAGERIPDATGRYYVTLTRDAWRRPVFTWVERAPGSPPVEPIRVTEELRDGFLPKAPAPAGDRLVRPGDRVLASGFLPRWPGRILVSSRGSGFVAVDATLASGPPVVLVSAAGTVRKIDRIVEDGEWRRFPDTWEKLLWLHDAWLDEGAGVLVLYGTDGVIRLVDLESGEVRGGGGREIERALRHPEARVRERGLELVIAWRRREAAGAAAELFEGPGEPLSVRLRAAVALAVAADDRRGVGLVTAAAAPDVAGIDRRDRRFAIESLPALLGKDALPLLLRAAPSLPDAAATAFADLGDAAVGPLLEEARERRSRWAVTALGRLGSRRALPALLRLVGDRGDAALAREAMEAAVAIAGPEIVPDLRALRDRGTAIDDEIDRHFADPWR